MRTVALIALTLIGSVAYGQAPPKPEAQSTRLALEAVIRPGAVKSGDPVFVELTVKNVSRSSVRLEDASAYVDYRVFVTNAAGTEPPRTSLGERMRNGEVGWLKNTQVDLRPGEVLATTMELGKVFVLAPGTYSARFVRGRVWAEKAADNQVAEVVSSNVVVFSVTP